MKAFYTLILSFCLMVSACSTQSFQTNEHGTRWRWDNGIIVVETPERPANQKSVTGLALPKLEVIRMGFVGLGTNVTYTVGAVERFTSIPDVQIVALCGYEQESTDKCLSSLQKASLPKAAVYFGKKGYEQLCKRDDIDLVYITADCQHHFPVAMCALENGKHVAIEAPSVLKMKERWNLVDMSEKTRKHCMPLILKKYTEISKVIEDHGNMNSIMDSRLVYCLQNGLPLDMDVYNLAEWCCRSELDSLSMNHDHAAVVMPDFSRGERNVIKHCKPAYATPEDEAASMEKAKAFTIKLKEQGAKEWAAE